MTELPAPLVPPDVDLREFRGMWVDVPRLLTSDTWVLGSGEERAAAFTLWAQSWHQVPAGSLPTDPRLLEHLSMSKRWKSVRSFALAGWVKCSDGRMYHPVVCEKALEAWVEKLAATVSGAIGNAKRWKVDVDVDGPRAKLIEAVDLLRNIAPESYIFKKRAVALILGAAPAPAAKPHRPPNRPPTPKASPPDAPAPIAPRSQPDRTELNRTEQVEREEHTPSTSIGGNPSDAAIAPRSPPDPPPRVITPSPAGRICRAMRQAGVPDANPGHPDLLALIAAGASDEEFAWAAAQAKDRGKGFAYALGTLKRTRAEAGKGGLMSGPMPVDAKKSSRADRQAATMSALTGRNRGPSDAPDPAADVVEGITRVVP